jgi:hypothetical protein
VRELIEALGIAGPDQLLWLLLDRAEGKPGLAAALVSAVKRNEYDRIWSGDAVADALLHSKNLGGVRSRAILAAISLGGDTGVAVEEAAELLQLTPLDVGEVVADLAAGGVVEEVSVAGDRSTHRLSVRPPVLRGLLVRDSFYSSGFSTNPTSLVERLRADARRVGGLAETLCDAALRGAAVPIDDMLEIVKRAAEHGSRQIWTHFAYTSKAASELILRRAPDAIYDAAPGLLHYLPELTLALLLWAETNGIAELFTTKPSERIRHWLDGDVPADPSGPASARYVG